MHVCIKGVVMYVCVVLVHYCYWTYIFLSHPLWPRPLWPRPCSPPVVSRLISLLNSGDRYSMLVVSG